MKKLFAPGIAICLILLPLLCRAQQEPPWDIHARDTNGWVQIDPDGVASGHNGVVVTNRDFVLEAEEATANYQTGDVQTHGSVMIVGRDHIWRGTNVTYNFKTTELHAGSFRTGQSPFFLAGRALSGSESTKSFYATNTIVTTDNFAEPAHKVRANKIVIVPGQYFELWNATLYLRGVPVFYWPHYKRYFGRHPNNFQFTPGYKSRFGPFLLTTYEIYFNEQLDLALHGDLRLKRGVAAGPDLNYHLGRWGDGQLRYYYAHDEDPDDDNVQREPLPVNRQRADLIHQATIDTNLTAQVVMHYQNDPQVIRDFFESEYRKNVQPKSFAEVNKAWPNFSLDIIAQPRLNTFFETVERLPEIKLNGFRQQVGDTPVYYESESSFDYFERKFSTGRYADTNSIGTNYSSARADTFHQFVLPKTLFGWLNVTPRAGGRVTYYSDASAATIPTNEIVRGVFNTGVEFSTKASRVWNGAESRLLEVNGLRHIIEPSVNYVFIPKPTARPPELPQFDSEIPSLRLLPIDFPQYDDIDSIDSQNTVRLTLQNRLQTKREDGVENLVNWAVYSDWHIKTRTNQTSFSDLYSDMDLRPRQWLTFNSQVRYDLANTRWREAYHSIIVQPNSTWSIALTHRFLINNDPEFFAGSNTNIPGHNTFQSSLYYRFNENWAARVSHRFEARDGKMEEQQYTIYRDLRSWTGALTLRVRQNRTGQPTDFTVAVTFSLKAIPRFHLGSDSEHPTLLLGS